MWDEAWDAVAVGFMDEMRVIGSGRKHADQVAREPQSQLEKAQVQNQA